MFKIVVIIFMFLEFIHNLWMEGAFKEFAKGINEIIEKIGE